MWTWLAMFIVAGRAQRGDVVASSTGLIAFLAMGVAGTVGCLAGGWASDRWGRAPTALAALLISGTCCVASPLFFRRFDRRARHLFVGVGRWRDRRLRCLFHLAHRDG